MRLSGLALAAFVPAALAAQTPARDTARTAQFAYRGFTPGMTYRDFAVRAQALARADTLRCDTSRRTAQVMDCGIKIRDPADSGRFYLSANVIDYQTSVIDFSDSGTTAIVTRAQKDLVRRFGPVQRREVGMWEWHQGRRFVRLNWRGRAGWRVISITLNDRDVMDRIAKYIPRKAKK
jgi:hypothetical protein